MGSASLARHLVEHDLVDENWLMISRSCSAGQAGLPGRRAARGRALLPAAFCVLGALASEIYGKGLLRGSAAVIWGTRHVYNASR